MKNKRIQKIINNLVDMSFSDGKMLEGRVIKSIKILKSLSRVDSIFALSEYLKGLKRVERAHTMCLESATAFSISQITKAKKIVEKKVRITKVKTIINPEILGGFKLKVGDEVWDESILGKINQVKEAIIHGRSN